MSGSLREMRKGPIPTCEWLLDPEQPTSGGVPVSDPAAIVRDALRRVHGHSSIESLMSSLVQRLEYAGSAAVAACYVLDPARYELRLAFLDDAHCAALARLQMLGVAPTRAVPHDVTLATLAWLAEMGSEPVSETGVSAALI